MTSQGVVMGISFPDPQILEIIKAAAEVRGANLSAFVREAALIQAQKVLEEQRMPLFPKGGFDAPR